MANLTKEELYIKTREAMGIHVSYQDDQLKPRFLTVFQYLKNAGISEAKLLSEDAVGLLATGVSDLWNYGAGGTTFSPFFYDASKNLLMSAEPAEEKTEVSADV